MFSYTTLLIIVSLITGILTTAITLSTTEFHLYNDPDHKFRLIKERRRIRHLAWFISNRNTIVPVCLLIILFLSIGQIVLVSLKERSDKLDDSKRNLQLISDLQNGISQTNEKLYKSLSKSFAEQGLQIDTLNEQIIKLRDSAKTIISNSVTEETVPFLFFKRNAIKIIQKNDRGIVFRISYAASGNSARINKAELAFFMFDDKAEIYFSPPALWLSEQELKQDGVYEKGVLIPDLDYKTIVFALKVNMSTISGKYTRDVKYILEYIKDEDATSAGDGGEFNKKIFNRLGW